MNTMIARYLDANAIAALNIAGEGYTDRAAEIILHGERGAFRSDADASMYIMGKLADLVAKANAFGRRIIADHASKRRPGKGIVIVNRRDGKVAVIGYNEYTNDGRNYLKPVVVPSEAEARTRANELWIACEF